MRSLFAYVYLSFANEFLIHPHTHAHTHIQTHIHLPCQNFNCHNTDEREGEPFKLEFCLYCIKPRQICWVSVCTCVRVFLSVCVCVCVFAYLCMCIFAFIVCVWPQKLMVHYAHKVEHEKHYVYDTSNSKSTHTHAHTQTSIDMLRKHFEVDKIPEQINAKYLWALQMNADRMLF